MDDLYAGGAYTPAIEAGMLRRRMMAQRLTGADPMQMPQPTGVPGVPDFGNTATAANPLAGLDMRGIAEAFKEKPKGKLGEPSGPSWLDRIENQVGGWFSGGGGGGPSSMSGQG